jgi:hypothetical protein
VGILWTRECTEPVRRKRRRVQTCTVRSTTPGDVHRGGGYRLERPSSTPLPARQCVRRFRQTAAMHTYPLARGLAAFLLLLPAAFVPAASAHEPPQQAVQVPRVSGEVVVDGRLDEAVWQQATRSNCRTRSSRATAAVAAVRDHAYIAYTDDALLLAFDARDPDPADPRLPARPRRAVQRRLRRRDARHLRRPAPRLPVLRQSARRAGRPDQGGGQRKGGRRLGRAVDQRRPDHRLRIPVEMRIPFATLRFRAGRARAAGACVLARAARENPYQYANQPVERGARCDLCAMRKLEGFAGIRQGRGLEVTPTLTVAHAQSRDARWRAWRGRAPRSSPASTWPGRRAPT